MSRFKNGHLKTIGGGTIHFCGNAEHQIENFCNTEGLTEVNNFCMGNFGHVYKMQGHFAAKKIALMICDFAPVDVNAYYDDLFSKLKTEGTIIASFPTYSIGLAEGRYEQICRNPEELAEEIYEALKTKVLLSNNSL